MSPAAAVAGLAVGCALLLAAGGGSPSRRLHVIRAQVRHRPQAGPGARPGAGPAAGSAAGSAAGPAADLPVDLVLELVAGLLDAGAPARQAVVLVERALADQALADRALVDQALVDQAPAEHARAEHAQADERSSRRVDGVAEVVALSESSGLPAAALLRARADDLRRARAAAHGRAVRRLGVQLVLPMGLCLLPAFVLLGVVPVVVDLLGTV